MRTSIYHLLFDDQQLDGFNAQFKILPPFRKKLDRDALLEGVKNGVIDVITSYHQPNEEEVNNVEFSIAPFGIIGTQITFPLSINLSFRLFRFRKNYSMHVYKSKNNSAMRGSYNKRRT